jgi:hypothetical protein
MLSAQESLAEFKKLEKLVTDYIGWDPLKQVGKPCKLYIPEQVLVEKRSGLSNYRVFTTVTFTEILEHASLECRGDRISYNLSLKGLGYYNKRLEIAELDKNGNPTERETVGWIVGIDYMACLVDSSRITKGGIVSHIFLEILDAPKDPDNSLEWEAECFLEFI